jgi:hypothetical protein
MGSLSAVSEAPISRQVVESRCDGGRFRYSDLKEAAPGVGLWVLYRGEQVRMICKVGVGGCARQLQREIVCFEAAGRGWREGWQGILGELRRRDPVRAGARGRFETAVAGSCSVLVEWR